MATSPETAPDRPILIVEDDGHICDLIVDALEAQGFQPKCVNADRDAYAALAEDHPYLAVIVDIHLGVGTTGYDVARFARKTRPKLPVAYISGQSSPTSFMLFGVPGSIFVQKPFAPDALASRVEALIHVSTAA